MMKVLEVSPRDLRGMLLGYHTPEQVAEVDALVAASKSKALLSILEGAAEGYLDELKAGGKAEEMLRASGGFEATDTLVRLLNAISLGTIRDATEREEAILKAQTAKKAGLH